MLSTFVWRYMKISRFNTNMQNSRLYNWHLHYGPSLETDRSTLIKLCRKMPRCNTARSTINDDVTKWKHFRRYWPRVRGIHLSPVNSPHKGQWRGVWWINNRGAADLRRHRAYYDVTVMSGHNDIWGKECYVPLDTSNILRIVYVDFIECTLQRTIFTIKNKSTHTIQ